MTTSALELHTETINKLKVLHALAMTAGVTVREAIEVEENEGIVDQKTEASLEQAEWWVKEALERIQGQLESRERAVTIMCSGGVSDE